MKGQLLAIFAIIICIIACSKDKFQTKPSLTLKSINSKNISFNGSMNIELEFTDKQGDVNDTLFFIKVRTNQFQTATLPDSLVLEMPADLPAKSRGIINLTLGYNDYLISAIDPPGPPGNLESDSLTFKFILKDKGNNTSDTLVIDNIVIQRQ